MKDKDLEALRSHVLEMVSIAERHYTDEVEPRILDAFYRYKADERFYEKRLGEVAKLSKVVSSDIADKVEWAIPSLMRIFFGSDNVITIQGRTEEDDRKAQLMEALINFQLQRQNNAFITFYRWFKDALKYGIGIVKAVWERTTKDEEIELFVSDDVYTLMTQTQEVPADLIPPEKVQSLEAVELKSAKFDTDTGLWKLKLILKRRLKNQPVIENCLPYEVIYVPDARVLSECSFVAHRKRVKADYLLKKQRAGIFRNVEKAIENASGGEISISELESEIYQDMTYRNLNGSLKEILLYECYTRFDINNDGLLEDVIVWMAGDTILRVEENAYGKPPFFTLSPILESETIMGRSFNDVIGQLQDLKTALLKLLMVNITKVSNPRVYYDAQVIPQEVLKETGILQYIPLSLANRNIQQVMQFEPVQPVAQFILPILEYIETQIENRTGITRYNQGLDARSLNKTATGVSLIMQASNQRLELIARIFAETGIRDLFRFLVELNQRFVDQELVIRLLNEPLMISPDDLKGEFDLIVNAGIGVGTKEQEMQFAQMLLGIVQQAVQAGLASQEELYNAFKKVIEQLGFKNVGDFLKSPQEVMNAQGIQGVGANGGGMQGIPPELVQALQEGALQQMGDIQQGGVGGDIPPAGGAQGTGEEAPQ